MGKAADRIEDVRVAWERDLEREAQRLPSAARPAHDDPGRNDVRVRLDRSMAERVHRIADHAAARLGYSEPFVLDQTPLTQRHISAQAILGETPFAVRLIGPVASMLDDEALAALIGHELGHGLALGPRASPPSTVLRAWEGGASAEIYRLGVFATEVTADRFSLIAAAGEIEAVVRLEVAIKTLDSPRALGVNELDYLAKVRGEVEAGTSAVFGPSTGYFDGYPSSEARLYAAWLFWRSEVHRELTGRGPGDLALRDVDRALRAMCDEALRCPRPPVRITPPAPREGRSPLTARPPVAENDAAGTWAESPFAKTAQAAAASALAKLESYVSAVVEDEDQAVHLPPDDPPSGPDGADELDGLETRFRALEREAAQRAPAGPAVPDDLETRFRALEEAERRK